VAKEQQKQAEATRDRNKSQPTGTRGKQEDNHADRRHAQENKAQRTPPEYTITDDDGEMIARMVQDCLSEDFDHAAHHRDRIQEELEDMRQFLKKIGKYRQQAAGEQNHQHHRQRKEWKKKNEIQSIHYCTPNTTFHITPSMLRMDEIVGQTPLKDLSQIQLVLTRMPSRALHKLQVSINHEVQSRAHKDLVELQQQQRSGTCWK
jgi:hypothetical protein